MYCNIQVLAEGQLEVKSKGAGDDEVHEIRSRLLEKKVLESECSKKLR